MKKLYILAFLFSTINLTAEISEKFIEENSKGIIAFYNRNATGTGFLVQSTKQLYIITAKHVLTDLKTPFNLALYGGHPKKTVYLNNIAPSFYKANNIDLAIIPIPPVNKKVSFIPFNLVQLENKINQPIRGQQLIAIGFPYNQGFLNKFAPFIYRINSASEVENVSAYNNKSLGQGLAFFLDSDLPGGFSGSPVLGKNGKIYGVLSKSTHGLSMSVHASYITLLIKEYEHKQVK